MSVKDFTVSTSREPNGCSRATEAEFNFVTAGVSTLSHKCHKEEMFSEVNFTTLSSKLRQLPTNDKRGDSEPILRITDHAMSSQQVVIPIIAGD